MPASACVPAQVVRLQGILQASLGPARGPQARRLINIDRVEKWFARAFYKGEEA